MLSASPSVINSGGSSMLTWSSTNATSCSASGAWSGKEPTSGNSSTGQLKVSSTYTLTCTGTGGNATATAVVSVGNTPPPPPPPASGITDNFQRRNQSGWGAATTGQTWQLNGKTFTISNNKGLISGNGASTATIGAAGSQVTVTMSGSLSGLNSTRLGALANYQDDNNWYMAYFDGSHFALLKRQHGTYSALVSKPFAAKAGTEYMVKLQNAGHNLSAKMWTVGTNEPPNWTLSAVDTSLSGGYGGVRAGLANNANASISSFALTQP